MIYQIVNCGKGLRIDFPPVLVSNTLWVIGDPSAADAGVVLIVPRSSLWERTSDPAVSELQLRPVGQRIYLVGGGLFRRGLFFEKL